MLKVINVLYDLRVLPHTYDIVAFLALAEAKRKLVAPDASIRLLLITGASRRPVQWDWGQQVEREEILVEAQSRLSRLILPAARLLPSIRTIELVDELSISGDIPAFYPDGYSFKNPQVGVYHKSHYLMAYSGKVDLRYVVNDSASMSVAERYLEQQTGFKNPVVLTVRNNVFSFDQSRNSRVEVNEGIYSVLRSRGIPFAVVPDTSMIGLAQFPRDIPLLMAPSFDLRLRSAVYEVAKFCLFEPTGPMSLAWFNPRVDFIAYGMAWSGYFSERYHLERGYKRDENIVSPGNSRQVYLWGDLTGEFLNNWIDSA